MTVASIENAGVYGEDFQKFFASDMLVTPISGVENVVDAISEILMATGQIRNGPRPSVESQVVIRQVIRSAVEDNQPVNVLAPWGSRKPGLGNNIDLAELLCLKTLKCVADSVRAIYPPGIRLRLRVEDVGGWWLFQNEGPAFVESSGEYCSSLEQLMYIMDGAGPVRIWKRGMPFEYIPELSLCTRDDYFKVASGILPLLTRFLEETDGLDDGSKAGVDSYSHLLDLGWKGVIPDVQRNYYRGLYRKFSPQWSYEEQTRYLARYFAGSFARYELNAVGFDRGEKFVMINLAHKVPGMPSDMADNRIQYRTMPERYTRDHIAPWRAKGFFRIREGGSKPGLSSFPQVANTRFHTAHVLFTNGGRTVKVQTDYTFEHDR